MPIKFINLKMGGLLSKMVKCEYCEMELNTGEIIYDKIHEKIFCSKGINVLKGRIGILKDSCVGKYGRQHSIGMFPTIVPVSKLEEEIELNMIAKGKK